AAAKSYWVETNAAIYKRPSAGFRRTPVAKRRTTSSRRAAGRQASLTQSWWAQCRPRLRSWLIAGPILLMVFAPAMAPLWGQDGANPPRQFTPTPPPLPPLGTPPGTLPLGEALAEQPLGGPSIAIEPFPAAAGNPPTGGDTTPKAWLDEAVGPAGL